jgi:hypothetical protein
VDKELSKAADPLAQNTVYTYPTIDALTGFIAGIIKIDQPKDGLDAMVQMVEKYSFNMDNSIKETSNTGKPTVVLITGTSGNLGLQTLVNLAENNAVHRIHALNRTSSGSQSISERHKGRFDDMGLIMVFLTLRNSFILTVTPLRKDRGSNKVFMKRSVD